MKFKDMPYERIDFAKAKAELLEIMENQKLQRAEKNSLKFTKCFIG